MKNYNDFNASFDRAKTSTWMLTVALIASGCSGQRPSTQGHPSAEGIDAGHHGGHGGSGGHHHRFEDAAEWSKVFDDPTRDAWQKPAEVVALMAIAPGMTVADVGAGTGYFLPHLSRAVGPAGKVIGEDVEPSMVRWIDERAKRENLGNVHGLLGDKSDPRLPARSVDRIVVVDTWHHIEDRAAFSAILANALKPDGAVFVIDFTPASPFGPPQHLRLAPDAVRHDLASAGLATDVVPSGLPHQYVVRGKRGP